ncbi:MAG: hypothetical protein ACO1SV_18325 [Fimbriimonas sp.]
MERLQKLCAIARRDDAEATVDVDLFFVDGTYCGLQADARAVRRVLDRTHLNLIQIEAEEGEIATPALVVGWPWPLRTGRLLLHAVAEGEEIIVHSRVGLSELGSTLVPGNPWLHLRGPLPDVAARLTLSTPLRGQDGPVIAIEVALPPEVALLSPPGQIIYQPERKVAVNAGGSLA